MDENKKPGPRDISDLKARLGLKKTGVMQAVTPPAGSPTPAEAAPQAGLPAPSGAQRAIPSPFGQPEPPPAQPAAPPDPRRDPFAQQQAANLAAFYGVGQVLPGSAEGVSHEPLSKPKPWGNIAGYAGVALVVFVVGNACGRVYNSRVEFNTTINQAAQIRDEIERLAKQLNTIADTLNKSAETMRGNVDFEMTAALGGLDLKKPDQVKLFHTNYAHFEDAAVERLFNYYDHTIRLYDELTAHARKSDADKDAINSFVKNGAGKGDKNYGVTFDMTGALPLAHFVELGSPVCPTEGQTDCAPAQLKGFKYRMDSGGSWGEKPVRGKPTDTVTPIQPNPLFKSVAAGNPDILAFKDYLRRVVTIKSLVQQISAEQKDVLGDLKKTADRPKVFTF